MTLKNNNIFEKYSSSYYIYIIQNIYIKLYDINLF